MKYPLIAIVGVAFLCNVSHAQNLGDAIQACSSTKNSLKRLICYDDLAKNLQQGGSKQFTKDSLRPISPSQPLKEKALVETGIQSEVVEQKSDSEFGFEHKRDSKELDQKIYAKVASIAKDRYKKLIITLGNGQKWKQSDSGTFSLKAAEVIYVERGSMGGFFLSKDEVNRRIRVKRIK
jgi:hypothetical protein